MVKVYQRILDLMFANLEIIAKILARNFQVLKNFGTHNNHIGVPNTIFQLNNRHDICVLELGTNHFGEIAYLSKIASPQVAAITNIGLSHIAYLKNIRGVLKEKISIARGLKPPNILLLNRDDALLKKLNFPKKIKLFYFGIQNNSDFMASDLCLKNNRVFFTFNKNLFMMLVKRK